MKRQRDKFYNYLDLEDLEIIIWMDNTDQLEKLKNKLKSNEYKSYMSFCHNISTLHFNYTEPPELETKFDIKIILDNFINVVNAPLSRSYQIDLDKLYENSYLDHTYGSVENIKLRMNKILNLPECKSDNKGRVKRILNFKNYNKLSKKRLLDIGAGIGVFPYMMRQNGWDVTGIETDHRMVEHLETNVGIKANHTTEINKMKKKKLTFDLISLNSIKHIYDP